MRVLNTRLSNHKRPLPGGTLSLADPPPLCSPCSHYQLRFALGAIANMSIQALWRCADVLRNPFKTAGE